MAQDEIFETEDKEEKKDKKQNPKDSKKGFDDSERMTLKINVQEALQYEAEKGKKKIGNLPKNLKKIKKKVRDSYDEDEDEGMDEDVIRSLRELQINQHDASNGDNSLINALNEQERRQIMQSTNIEITRHEERAGKQDALEQADTNLRKSTLRKMNTQEFMNEMNDAIYNPSRLRREAMEHSIAKQMGIKGKIEKHHEGDVVEGVKKVKDLSGNRKVKSLKMKDVQKVGEKRMSQNQTAELILKKSGQTAKLSEIKRQSQSSYNKDNEKGKQQPKKSYAKEMKELLRQSMQKNEKIH
ncbi:MAG: hypothetical protein IJ532_02500 [Alphaproteobacteria bacterium]|nr:hypothetical protein [Alphaproteobacteria bacterium]